MIEADSLEELYHGSMKERKIFMNVRDLTKRLEEYSGSPLISIRQICEMVGDSNSGRVKQKFDLNALPRFGGNNGKYACQDVAESMMAKRFFG